MCLGLRPANRWRKNEYDGEWEYWVRIKEHGKRTESQSYEERQEQQKEERDIFHLSFGRQVEGSGDVANPFGKKGQEGLEAMVKRQKLAAADDTKPVETSKFAQAGSVS